MMTLIFPVSSVTSKWLTIHPEVLNPDDGGSPLAAIPLHRNLLDDLNGTIKHVAIMVAEKGHEVCVLLWLKSPAGGLFHVLGTS